MKCISLYLFCEMVILFVLVFVCSDWNFGKFIVSEFCWKVLYFFKFKWMCKINRLNCDGMREWLNYMGLILWEFNM